MPQHNEALARWKASVPPGICPACKKKLPAPLKGRGNRRQIVHPTKSCRKAYMTVRQRGTRPATTLRTVASMTDVEGRRGRVLMTFAECHHTEEAHRSKVNPGWRRRCRVCDALSNTTLSTPK